VVFSGAKAMAVEKLNDDIGRYLKDPGTHSDGKGLYLRVRAEGQGSWTVKFGTREKSLGPADLIDIETARATHKAMRLEKKAGRDPWALLEAQTETKKEEEKQEQAAAVLFGDLIEPFLALNATGWKGGVDGKEAGSYRKTLAGHLSGLPAATITSTDIQKHLEPFPAATADKVRMRVMPLIDYAVALGIRPEGPNPARKAVMKNLMQAVPDSTPHPAMLLKDLPAFMADLAADKSNEARALAFCIHTAARTAGARDADWKEITEVDGLPTWIIPANRTKEPKNGDHRIPLTSTSLALLGPMRTKGRIFGDLPHDALDDKLKELRPLPMVPMDNGRPDAMATVHGFRSTFRDWIDDETDFLGDLGEFALHHVVGKPTKRKYARSDQLKNRRPLMQAWSEFLTG
jgi:integrase